MSGDAIDGVDRGPPGVDGLAERLSSATEAGHKYARRLRWMCYAVGLASTLACALLLFLSARLGLHRCTATVASHFSGIGLFSLSFSLLPIQTVAIQRSTEIIISITMAFVVWDVIGSVKLWRNPLVRTHYIPDVYSDETRLWYTTVFAGILATQALGFLAAAVGLTRDLWCRRLAGRAMLECLLRTLAILSVWLGLCFTLHLGIDIYATGFFRGRSHGIGVLRSMLYFALAAAHIVPGIRSGLQARLVGLTGKVDAAVVIAGLLGGRSPKNVLTMAKEKCRCIPLDRVQRMDLASNTPDPNLYPCSEAVKLGEIDAFISHSWHDPPDEKWDALQQWGCRFRDENGGKEPRVWIDKYCIEQGNIEDHLAALPVFLAGCSRLVVLCGDSYPSRLWCLVELFTFLAMGGCRTGIIQLPLSGSDVDWSKFDATQATCFEEEDRDRLLGIIEAFSGTMDSFNSQIKSMLSEDRGCLV